MQATTVVGGWIPASAGEAVEEERRRKSGNTGGGSPVASSRRTPSEHLLLPPRARGDQGWKVVSRRGAAPCENREG